MDVARTIEAADSGWALAAIFLLGIYALLWKFGRELLELARTNQQVAQDNHQKTTEITESIRTNHGSKNLGDAVDRLTEEVWAIRARLDEHLASSSTE